MAVACILVTGLGLQRAAPAQEPPLAGTTAPPANPESPPPSPPPPATDPAPSKAPGSAIPDPDAWLHQPEGQVRLNRVIDEQRQEVKTQTAAHHPVRAAEAYAVAYAFTPLHGLLIQVGRAAVSAGKLAEARILFERLLAENPEPLLRVQAAALLQEVTARPGLASVDVDATIKGYVDQGKAAFHSGAYAQSVAAYAMAQAMQDLPRLLFNMAQAYRRLGHSERAFLMYHRFLQSDPHTTLRNETEGYIAELRLLTELEGPAHAPRPKWRIAAGVAALGVGVGLIGIGAGALAVNGQCVTTDATGQCAPDVDGTGRALLPRSTQIFNTTAVGASLIAIGAAITTAATVVIALPGKRLRPQVTAALGPFSWNLGLTLQQ